MSDFNIRDYLPPFGPPLGKLPEIRPPSNNSSGSGGCLNGCFGIVLLCAIGGVILFAFVRPDIMMPIIFSLFGLILAGSILYGVVSMVIQKPILLIVVILIVFYIISLNKGNDFKAEPTNNSNARAVMYINTANLNLRSSPGADQSIVTVLPNGTQVELLGESQNVDGSVWIKVSANGYTGWVNQKYLR